MSNRLGRLREMSVKRSIIVLAGVPGHNTGEATDPLLEAIDSCKKENRDDKKFVLEVIAAPELSILLASDQQLQ